MSVVLGVLVDAALIGAVAVEDAGSDGNGRKVPGVEVSGVGRPIDRESGGAKRHPDVVGAPAAAFDVVAGDVLRLRIGRCNRRWCKG